MKKQTILLIIILLILPTILAETSMNLPDQEPTIKKLDLSKTCYDNRLTNINQQIVSGTLSIILIIFIIDLIFKGFALWKATHKNHKVWFTFMLILNTAGILPIIYLVLNRNK